MPAMTLTLAFAVAACIYLQMLRVCVEKFVCVGVCGSEVTHPTSVRRLPALERSSGGRA